MVVCKHKREQEVPALWGGLGDSRRGETWRSERGEEKLWLLQQEWDAGAEGTDL